MLADSPPVETLPPPPRPLTARVRRRAWAEPHVRFWWLAAVALVAAGVYMVVVEYREWRREVSLVENGVPVKARVEQAGGERVGGRAVPPGVSVQLSYDWEGQRRESWGMLEGREPPDEVILTKSTIPIRVDPEDPQRWTYRKQPPGIVADLLGAALAFALAPLALLASVALRRGVLRTWRDGEAADAIVVGRHGTALAPGTRAVKCTPAGPQAEEDAEGAPAQHEPHDAPAGGGSRVHTVYVPLRHGDAAGDLLRVILPPRGKGRPLAAAWFE